MRVKCFDVNLRRHGLQFEVGKVYETDTKGLSDFPFRIDTVFDYFETVEEAKKETRGMPREKKRFCEIEVLGKVLFHEPSQRHGTNRIRIIREVNIYQEGVM